MQGHTLPTFLMQCVATHMYKKWGETWMRWMNPGARNALLLKTSSDYQCKAVKFASKALRERSKIVGHIHSGFPQAWMFTQMGMAPSSTLPVSFSFVAGDRIWETVESAVAF